MTDPAALPNPTTTTPTDTHPTPLAAPANPPATTLPADPPASPTITIDDFKKVDLRVARVLQCRKHPKADKLLILTLDVGDHQRQVCAGMAPYYAPDDLVGRLIVVCVNLAARQLRGEDSNGMMLAATDAADPARVIVLSPEKSVAPGSRIS